jgi:hypothetical protein
MTYVPVSPTIACACGNLLIVGKAHLIEPDTGDYQGAIWQFECTCGRAYTVEVANDPNYSSAGGLA